MKEYTINEIRELSPCYDPAKYLHFEWTGTLIDILRVYDCPALERLWTMMKLSCKENEQRDNELHEKIIAAYNAMYDVTSAAEDEETIQVERIIQFFPKLEDGCTTYTIDDFCLLQPWPYYNQTEFLPPGWKGTLFDILSIENCPNEDKLWVVTSLLKCDDLVHSSPFFWKMYEAWRSLRDLLLLVGDDVCQIPRIIALLEEENLK